MKTEDRVSKLEKIILSLIVILFNLIKIISKAKEFEYDDELKRTKNKLNEYAKVIKFRT